MRRFGILLVLVAYFYRLADGVCTLPPDFWCDNTFTAIKCTGSTTYCERYGAARAGKPAQIHLAFESACPDSQRFVVDRLYPKVLNNPQIAPLIDFKAYPWGLAKRETAEKVTCHHRERECVGNRLLTCTNSFYANNPSTQAEVLHCFMSLMFNKQQDPEAAMLACLGQARASPAVMQTIVACSKSPKSKELQRVDEAETRRILSQPRFVPYISLNGYSHIQLQAHQMILADKLRSWNATLQRIRPSGVPTSRGSASCQVPPEFWCTTPATMNACYSQAGCAQHAQAVAGKPLHLKVIYTDAAASRNYVLGYLKRNFLLNSAANRRQMGGKVEVELEPAASATAPCGPASCFYQAVQHCVASHVRADTNTRNQMLLCLLESGGDMLDSWMRRCHTFKPAYRDIVANCVNSGAWKREVMARAQAQSALKPEPPRHDPWILINGYSLSTVQNFANILDRMICLWYRGPGHDRDACFRCEYEMTHCMG